MIVTNKSASPYVYTVINISNRDLMFSPNHMCLLSVNAITLLLIYFEIKIMSEKVYLMKKDYAGCSLPYIAKHTSESVKGST